MKTSRLIKLAGISVLAVGVLIGVLFALGILGVPDGGLEDNEWGQVEEQRIEIITTVWVDNPNPFGIGGDADVEYTVALQGIDLAQGDETGVGISTGENELEFSTDLRHQRLPRWWSSHLNNDEVSEVETTATVHASVGPLSGSPGTTVEETIDTDLEGALDTSFSSFEGAYPDDRPWFEITDATAAWGEVTEAETELLVTFEIENPTTPVPAPVPTPEFEGDVEFNEIPMAQWNAGEVELLRATESGVIPPGETEQRTFVVVMDNQNVPEWFASHVAQDEFTEGVVTGSLTFDANDREITVPTSLECDFDLQTSIFVAQETTTNFGGCDVNTDVEGGRNLDEGGLGTDPIGEEDPIDDDDGDDPTDGDGPIEDDPVDDDDDEDEPIEDDPTDDDGVGDGPVDGDDSGIDDGSVGDDESTDDDGDGVL